MAKTVLRIGSRLDLGMVRDNQEDSLRIYLPEQQAVQEEKGALFIVADGVGGHQAGDVASALAVEVLTEAYYASASRSVEDALRDAIAAANTRIYEEAQARASQAGMGSTCVCVALRGSHIGVANVGDSRVYILRDGKLTQISQDHSWVAEQVRSGQLSQEEANASQFRNVLTQALGSAPQVEPSVRGQTIRQGDAILLCSDGLTTMLDDNEIAAFVTQYDDPQEACDMLIEAANHRGGKDNISIIVVRVDTLQTTGTQEAYAAEDAAAADATQVHPVIAAPTPASEREATMPHLGPAARNTLAPNAVAARPVAAATTLAPASESTRASRWPLALLVVAVFFILAALYIIFHNQLDPILNNIASTVGLASGQLDPIIGAIGLLLMLLFIWLAVRGGARRESERNQVRPARGLSAPAPTIAPHPDVRPTATMNTAAAEAALPPAAFAPDTVPATIPITEHPASHIIVSYPFGHEAYDVAAVLGTGSDAIGSCVLSAPTNLLGSVDDLGKPATRGFWLTLYDRTSGESTVAVLLSPRAAAEEWSAISASLPQDPMVRFSEIREIKPGLQFQLDAGHLHAAVTLLDCHYLVAGRQRTPDRYVDALSLACDVGNYPPA